MDTSNSLPSEVVSALKWYAQATIKEIFELDNQGYIDEDNIGDITRHLAAAYSAARKAKWQAVAHLKN